jgi:hypothetical protein
VDDIIITDNDIEEIKKNTTKAKVRYQGFGIVEIFFSN